MGARSAGAQKSRLAERARPKGAGAPKPTDAPRASSGKSPTGGARLDKWRFRIAAFAVIEREGMVLLARRRDIGWWNLPGGGLESGETVDEGLLREVREEVCAEVRVARLVGVYSKPQKNEVVLTFLCHLEHGQDEAIGTSDEVSEIGWFAPEALPVDLLPKHRQRVLDAFAGQLTPIMRAQRSSTEEDQKLPPAS